MTFQRAFYWLFPLLIPTLAIYFTVPKAPLISKFWVLSSPPLLPRLKGDSDITVQVVIHSFQGYLERCFSYKDCNQISVCPKGCLCLDCSGLYPSLAMFSYPLTVNVVIRMHICCNFFCYKWHLKFCSQGIRVEIPKAFKSLEHTGTFQLLQAANVRLCHQANKLT